MVPQTATRVNYMRHPSSLLPSRVLVREINPCEINPCVASRVFYNAELKELREYNIRACCKGELKPKTKASIETHVKQVPNLCKVLNKVFKRRTTLNKEFNTRKKSQ